MRRPLFPGLLLSAVTLVSLTGLASVVQGQQTTNVALGKEQLVIYAKAYTAIAQLRDQIQAELAAPKNKTDQAQTALQQKQREGVAKILQENNLSHEQYQRLTFAVSTNGELRRTLDDIMGIKPPTPPASAPAAGSASAAGTHLGHVASGFSGTPKGEGLLPTALAEANVVLEHAALAARNTDNLA